MLHIGGNAPEMSNQNKYCPVACCLLCSMLPLGQHIATKTELGNEQQMTKIDKFNLVVCLLHTNKVAKYSWLVIPFSQVSLIQDSAMPDTIY